MTGVIDVLPVILMVWMIGFSGDSHGLRMGGFIVLAIKWLAPHLLVAVFAPLVQTNADRANVGLAATLVISLLLGAYLILWSVRSVQAVRIRIALAIAGLFSLRQVFIIGVMTLATSGR